MAPLIQREFVVDVPNEQAWDHLLQVEAWPQWAGHIRRMRVDGGEQLTPGSTTRMTLKPGVTLKLEVNRYQPERQFRWFSYLGWLTLDYDHRFEPVDENHTRMIWTVELDGFGARFIGPIIARLYGRSLDQAIPKFVGELKAA